MFFSFIIVEQIIGYIKHSKKIRGTMSDSVRIILTLPLNSKKVIY